jgi:hypothetical protein
MVEGQDPSKRDLGLHNVIVFGRAVTIALQRLRSRVKNFDTWYAKQAPPNDPLLAYINELRNNILKQGEMPFTSSRAVINEISFDRSLLHGTPPPGATRVFIGDHLGGSGWYVRLPDGSEETFYAELSEQFQGTVTLEMPGAPTHFLGEPLADASVSEVAGRYVCWLVDVVDRAERQFTPR